MEITFLGTASNNPSPIRGNALESPIEYTCLSNFELISDYFVKRRIVYLLQVR